MPLCPDLYKLLIIAFGEVKISHEGEAFDASTETYVDRDNRTRVRWNIRNRGETYRVCCPFCGDKRFRLWINHRWGRFDPVTGNRNLRLIYCFNEDCFREFEKCRYLAERVFGGSGITKYSLDLNLAPVVKRRKPILPGPTTALHQLPANHHACEYIRERGFDPSILGKYLGIGYCPQANDEFPLASNRIIIPIYQRGSLQGWQARYVGERNWKAIGIPKYYTMPDMDRQNIVYNFDTAKENSNFVVMSEGPMDVWSIGPNGIATFGKTISRRQKDLITHTWGCGCVIIFLDPDAADDAQALEDDLKGEVREVMVVMSEDGRDPGSMRHDEIWGLIYKTAAAKGISLAPKEA